MKEDPIKECLARLTDAQSICDGLIQNIEKSKKLQKKKMLADLLLASLAIGLICLAYWGNGNHLAVEVPVVDSAIVQRLQREKGDLERKVADYKTLVNNLSVQIKSRNFVIAQYEQQLKELAVSVPPQPVILQAVQKEASTPAGLQRVVARSFGKEFAGRIRVINE